MKSVVNYKMMIVATYGIGFNAHLIVLLTSAFI